MKALIIRIVKQLKNDKRSIALMFIAPLMIMTFLYFLLGESKTDIKIGLVNSNEQIEHIFSQDNEIIKLTAKDDLDQLLKDKDIDVIVSFNNQVEIKMLESNNEYQKEVNNSLKKVQSQIFNQQSTKISYIYGEHLNTMFEQLSYVLLGIISFFLIFLFAGVSFVKERTTGTLERFMLTPIKRSSVVLGYTFGFGVFAVIQSITMLLFVQYGLNIVFIGSLLEAILIMVLLSIAAVSIGMFISIFAQSEFQVVQFIPIIIIPQIFFSGLLPISSLPLGLANLKLIMPIYYGCNGLKKILVNGLGLVDIWLEILMLLMYICVFFIINIIALKKYRSI